MNQYEKNRKASIIIILIFIAVHFLTPLSQLIYPENWQEQGMIFSSVVFFAIGMVSMVIVERKYGMHFLFEQSYKRQARSIWLWGITGIFIVLFTQGLAVYIEAALFGISMDSVNTQTILEIIRQYPIFILFAGIAGPIMEEYVFRKAIFGFLFEKIGGIGAAVVSSLIFAFVHFDGHYLLYSSIALVFCWLYYKTKNLWTPIITHCLMNSFVILANLYFS